MFKKYRSLTNHYAVNTDYLDLNQEVYVSEKIDGSNFSICVEDGDYRFASRNQLVGDDWNGANAIVSAQLVSNLLNYARENNCTINLFGEVFSSKILKRIPYGETKIRFYDIAINGSLASQTEFIYIAAGLKLDIVPVTIMTLKEALELDVESLKTNYAKDAMAEGIVIKPVHGTEFNERVSYIKKKAEKFLETAKEKIHKPKKHSPEAEKFLNYINENRVISYISKYGEMQDMSQMSVYIKGILADAIEEYEAQLTPDEMLTHNTGVFAKGGGRVAHLLKERLNAR